MDPEEKPPTRKLTEYETELHKMESDYAELSKQLLVSKEQTQKLEIEQEELSKKVLESKTQTYEMESKTLVILQKLMPSQNLYLIDIIKKLVAQQKDTQQKNQTPTKENNLIDIAELVEPSHLLDSLV
jgi:hypothetical protein